MKRVLIELGKFKKQLILLVLAVFGTVLCVMGLPTLFKIIVDEAIPSKDIAQVIQVSGAMLIFVVVAILCGIATAKLAAMVSMGVGRNLRTEVFTKVQSLSQEEIDAFTPSSLIARTNNDIILVQQFLNQSLMLAIEAPILCILGMAMALKTSPALSSTLIIAIPVLAVVLVIVGKKALPLSYVIQKKLDRVNMVIREKLTGVRVIRAFATNDFETEKFKKINEEYTDVNKKLQYVTASFLPLIYVILAATIGSVLFAAYYITTSGIQVLTSGEILAVVQYIVQIMMGVTMLTIVILLMPRAAAAAHRAEEVLNSINKISDPEKPETSEKRGYIEFKDVSFTYAGADVPALKHLSFKSKPGEITAIIGGTGMGKSTIVNLIPRLYDVTEGQILIDDIDIRNYSIKDLREKVGFVPQKAILFKGTIDSNLQFGDENPTEDRIENAVKIAQSYDFVMGKENGFQSDVAQGGGNFSGGQKQRLCIARALVRKPEIYIFDDSFSALDFKTDKALRTALRSETGDASTIIVAQRISTIMDADRIIVIEQGDIVGIGTHHELLNTCSIYKEIVDSQLSKEEAGNE